LEAKIYFIVLNSSQKQKVVCDLAEKCYQAGKRVVIFCEDQEKAKELDLLLWTWKQSSFIPHIYSATLETSFYEPILVTSQIGDSYNYNVLILSDTVTTETLNKFEIVIEFAEKYDLSRLNESRKRYKMYKSQDYQIETLQPGEFLTTQLE
jgi:DNA polymerase-3 subunit chi